MNDPTITSAEGSIESSHRGYEIPTPDLHDLLRAPPIDLDRLLEQCLDSLSFALTMLDEFERTSFTRLAAFDAAQTEHNHAAVATQAHALKGVAGILAADSMMETCSNLESATKLADWNQTGDLIQQLHQEAQRAIDFIPSIRTPTSA